MQGCEFIPKHPPVVPVLERYSQEVPWRKLPDQPVLSLQSWRFSERPCIKIMRGRAVDTWHAAMLPGPTGVNRLVCMQKHTHANTHAHGHTRKTEGMCEEPSQAIDGTQLLIV